MARNVIEVNRRVFEILETYCANRSALIPTAGLDRFVAGGARDERYVKYAEVVAVLRFGTRRALVQMNYESRSFIGVVGFEFEVDLPQLATEDVNAGMLVLVISELEIRPVLDPSSIRNIVEVGSMLDDAYSGHGFNEIASLFPELQAVDVPSDLVDSIDCIFLLLSLDECRRGESWINDSLATELAALTELEMAHLPYAAISRSVFDLDPRTMFMALYRCIEATYAFDSCRKLVQGLGLTQTWFEIAKALEDSVGWHPREAESLNGILRLAIEDDLLDVCICLRQELGADVASSAGKAIYGLRNRVVHFRPGHETNSLDHIDWNELCALLARIVFQVFANAFEPLPR